MSFYVHKVTIWERIKYKFFPIKPIKKLNLPIINSSLGTRINIPRVIPIDIEYKKNTICYEKYKGKNIFIRILKIIIGLKNNEIIN